MFYVYRLKACGIFVYKMMGKSDELNLRISMN